MKILLLTLFALTANLTTLLCQKTDGIEKELQQKEFETFEMKEGDTTYVMKKYYLGLYKEGENRTQDEEALNVLQKDHLAHIGKMAEMKKVCIAGPFDDGGENRGLLIFSTYSKEEAAQLMAQDPMVKAGRLTYQILPFWAAKDSVLF